MNNINKGTATIFHQSGKPYTSISNAVVESINNPDSLAIWTFLQTKDNGWNVIGSYLQDKFSLGRKRYSDAMGDLVGMGLVEYVTVRNDLGQVVGRRVIVNYEPVLTEVSENPHVGQPALRSTCTTVNRHLPIKDSLPIKDLNQSLFEGLPSDRIEKLDYETSFENFWAEYPRKTDKKKSREIWMKLKPSDELVKTIMLAIQSQRKSEGWTKDGGKYIPHPTTWLNGERWSDELGDQGKAMGELDDHFMGAI